MNHRFLAFLLVPAFSAVVFASCSDASAHAANVEKLLGYAASVSKELEVIDPSEAEQLYLASTDVKEQFKTQVKNDTLDLAFAEKLDRYLKANRQLKGLAEERRRCLEANEAARQRLQSLKEDIAAGSGDRSRYTEFVSSETQEMARIRTHCNSIALRFHESKAAIAQFQPEIERFISQFVSPSAP